MPAQKDTLIQWLRDVHAMETAGVDNLDKQIEGSRDYPTLQTKFREHREVTRRQVERLDQCLQRLGADRSGLKEAFTKFVSKTQSWLTSAADDAILKQTMSVYSVKHFEIAAYTNLIAAANYFNEPEIALACETSLSEEQAIADWLRAEVPGLTRMYLDREGEPRQPERKAG